MQKARLVLSLVLLLILGLILIGCDGSLVVTVPLATPATPTRAARVSPIVLPSATPAPMPAPPPTASPAPAGESRWQCAPDGGLTCFGGFSYIDMLNEQEGWAYGSGGIVLHYTTPPGGTVPTWQPVAYLEGSLNALSMVSPTEGWAIISRRIYHFKDGVWENAQVPGVMNDIFMLNEQEGWAVGEDGVILHYQQGEWQVVASPTDKRLNSIAMLNAEEGWAVGIQGGLLHYHDGQWEQENINFYDEYHDIEFVSEDEGWVVGHAILHYQSGDWQEVITLFTFRKHGTVNRPDKNSGV
jgi:hypothetical protein